jgi:hypothetical protein
MPLLHLLPAEYRKLIADQEGQCPLCGELLLECSVDELRLLERGIAIAHVDCSAYSH